MIAKLISLLRLGVLALVCAPLAASAQPASVVGTWRFKTETGNISGLLTIKGLTSASLFLRSGGRGANETCEVSVDGERVAILCKVDSGTTNWTPDNFDLVLIDDDHMKGTLVTGREYKVAFTRQGVETSPAPTLDIMRVSGVWLDPNSRTRYWFDGSGSVTTMGSDGRVRIGVLERGDSDYCTRVTWSDGRFAEHHIVVTPNRIAFSQCGGASFVLTPLRTSETKPGAGSAVSQPTAKRSSAGQEFRDCLQCPAMVVIPAGTFRMGSPENELGREAAESPSHAVSIGYEFAVGKFEVTRREFAAFVSETHTTVGGRCLIFDPKNGPEEDQKWDWQSPGFPQTPMHPVTCVTWDDARAYVDWLSRKTGRQYRLLTEAEHEYVLRGGTTTRFAWGENENDACDYGNMADQEVAKVFKYKIQYFTSACSDGSLYTSPVGSYGANAFGLHDINGNVAEWTEDCLHYTYVGAPQNGGAWTSSGSCAIRIVRGGSWNDGLRLVRSARRNWSGATNRFFAVGFRVARGL